MNTKRKMSCIAFSTGFVITLLFTACGFDGLEGTSEEIFQKTAVTWQVTSEADEDTPGTLRHAIANAWPGDTIVIAGSVEIIHLKSRLELDLRADYLGYLRTTTTIQGNGVILTRDPGWTGVDDNSQLLFIDYGYRDNDIHISRIYFKDGRATAGGAIYNDRNSLTLESCIFSGNQATNGGAIYHYGHTLNIRGCTFYGNSANGWGGVIYSQYNNNIVLTGNLFYGNTADDTGHIVYREYGGNITSGGYNISDVSLETVRLADTTFADMGIGGTPFSTTTFTPVSALRNVIPSRPANFPVTEFNGAVRSWPGAPGAVW